MDGMSRRFDTVVLLEQSDSGSSEMLAQALSTCGSICCVPAQLM